MAVEIRPFIEDLWSPVWTHEGSKSIGKSSLQMVTPPTLASMTSRRSTYFDWRKKKDL